MSTAVFVAVAVLVVVVLATPLRLALRLGTDPGGIALRLVPFGGVLGEVSLSRRSARPSAPAKRLDRTDSRRKLILRALPQFVVELSQRVRIDQLRVSARFGTGDPALTGQIYGQLMPLAHGPFLPPAAEVRLLPVFDRACLSGDAEVVLRVTPFRLAGPLLRLLRAGFGRPS